MLPVETLKHIQQMTKDANWSGCIVTTDREPDHVYYVVQPDGSLARTTAARTPDAHQSADLETLVKAAALRASAVPKDASAPEIWYSREGVVAVLDPAAGIGVTDRVFVKLSASPQLAKLAEWERAGKASPTQTELIILLRTLFSGCAPADFLTLIRNVSTKRANEVQSGITQGKVSLGKSMVAEMTGAAAIPERIALYVPVFAQAALYIGQPIHVEIDPDPTNERFNLHVIPGDVERAYATAEELIGSRLEGLLREQDGAKGIRVFRGVP